MKLSVYYNWIYSYMVIILLLLCTHYIRAQHRALNSPEPSDFEIDNSPVFTSLKKACHHPESVYKLDLTRQGYQEFPEDIFKLKQLRYLQLDHNEIKSIPKEIASLKYLIMFSAEGNQIKHVPEEINALNGLEFVDLSHNQLEEFPLAVCKLPYLRQLLLNNNALTTTPESIGSLSRLEVLHLEENKISELPESLKNLTNLLFLSVKGNQLEELPQGIFTLYELETLDVSNNQLETISSQIGNLRYLFYLNISSNKIRQLPDEFYFLPFVEKLFIDNNNITEIKHYVLEMQNLTVVDIGANPMKDLPLEFGKLVKLRTLFIDDMEFEKYPQALYDLSRQETDIEGEYVKEAIEAKNMLIVARNKNADGERDSAVEKYYELIRRDTNNMVALTELAEIYLNQRNFDMANKLCLSALSKYGSYENVKKLRKVYTNCLNHTTDDEQIIEQFNSRINDLNDSSALFEFGKFYYDRKQYSAARLMFEQSVLRNPYHPESHLYLSIIGNINKDEKAMKLAACMHLLLYPQNSGTHSLLDFIYNNSTSKSSPYFLPQNEQAGAPPLHDQQPETKVVNRNGEVIYPVKQDQRILLTSVEKEVALKTYNSGDSNPSKFDLLIKKKKRTPNPEKQFGLVLLKNIQLFIKTSHTGTSDAVDYSQSSSAGEHDFYDLFYLSFFRQLDSENYYDAITYYIDNDKSSCTRRKCAHKYNGKSKKELKEDLIRFRKFLKNYRWTKV